MEDLLASEDSALMDFQLPLKVQTKLLSHLQKIRDIREIERAQEAMMNDLENEDDFEVLT